jgi:hypothetical protein
MCIQSPRSTDRPWKWRHHFNQFHCAHVRDPSEWSRSTDRLDVIKEKSHGCESTNPHLCFVVTPANICLARNPHLARVESGSLLQANNQHFLPVLSTIYPTSWYQDTHSSPGQTRDRRGGVQTYNTLNLTRVENAGKTREKKKRVGKLLFNFPRAEM